jgi:DNA-binding IclR family transcriptional regulator
VINDLVVAPDSEPTRRERDVLIERLRHSEYLATENDPDDEVQVIQISAPVFDAEGDAVVSLMVLGTTRPMRGCEVQELAERVVQAADRATTLARDLRLGDTAAM